MNVIGDLVRLAIHALLAPIQLLPVAWPLFAAGLLMGVLMLIAWPRIQSRRGQPDARAWMLESPWRFAAVFVVAGLIGVYVLIAVATFVLTLVAVAGSG